MEPSSEQSSEPPSQLPPEHVTSNNRCSRHRILPSGQLKNWRQSSPKHAMWLRRGLCDSGAASPEEDVSGVAAAAAAGHHMGHFPGVLPQTSSNESAATFSVFFFNLATASTCDLGALTIGSGAER